MNRIGITGANAPDKLKGLIGKNIRIVRLAGSALAGFIMAKSFVFGGVAPFGVSVSAALPGAEGCFAAMGALLGYVLTAGMLRNIKYIGALLLTVIFKWTLTSRLGKRESAALNVVVTALAMLASSVAVIVAMNYSLYDIMLGAAELMLACGSVYFFTRTLRTFDGGLAGAAKADLSCVAVSLTVVLMGFSGFSVKGVSIGRVISAAIVMLCARYGGEAIGAVSGIIAGAAAGFSSGSYGYMVASYALAGLVAGAFGDMGRAAVASAFIIVNALTALFTGEAADVYSSVLEIFLAAVIFIFTPKGFIRNLRLTAFGVKDGSPVQLALRDRLGGISSALREIGGTTRRISEKLGKPGEPGVSDIYNGAAEKVCRRCGLKEACWQERKKETARSLASCVDILKKRGGLVRENAPGYLIRHCCRLDALISEINTGFNGYIAKEGARRKVAQVRSVVTDQFDGMAAMLEEISGELCSIKLLEPQKAQRARDYFEKEGLTGEKLLCYTDSLDRVCVELQMPSYMAARVNRAKAAVELGELLEAEFDLPQITVKENTASVRFGEKAAFTVEIGAYQIACGDEKYCGDAYDYIRERSGKTHLVISDGMGSGGAAAVDSSMTTGLLSSLLSIGIGHEAALKLVNSALLVKSGEESLATVDICTLDLFTGRAEFYKAGAAPSFILRGGRAGCVESASLPAGILRGVSFDKSVLTLRTGDTVVMVSDGVVTSGFKWVMSELESMEGADMQRLCEKLAVTARARREDGREDDITVVAAIMRGGNM